MKGNAMNHTDLNTAKAMLDSGGYTCVLCMDNTLYTATERGVKPLVRWLTEGLDATGFSAADRVVGRATAYLYQLLGVKEVYAHVMSRSAAEVLDKGGIRHSCGTLAEHIINRQGTGICPFEEAVLHIDDPQIALTAIREKMSKMNISL